MSGVHRAHARRRTAIGWLEADQIADKLRAALQLGRVPKDRLKEIAEKHAVSVTWLRKFAGARQIPTEQ